MDTLEQAGDMLLVMLMEDPILSEFAHQQALQRIHMSPQEWQLLESMEGEGEIVHELGDRCGMRYEHYWGSLAFIHARIFSIAQAKSLPHTTITRLPHASNITVGWGDVEEEPIPCVICKSSDWSTCGCSEAPG